MVRLVGLAVLLALVVLLLYGASIPVDLRTFVATVFFLQVALATALVSADLVRRTRRDAERRALLRFASLILATQEERDRAVTGRDELARTVAELRALTTHLRDELRSRDDAVASAVHELRTPLTTVHAYGQLMSRNLEAVQRQVGQLERLISDLLQMPAKASAEQVDLLREIEEAAHRLELLTEARVDLRVEDEGPHVVSGDAGRLAQVLDNVLRNAIKFSPPGAPVRLTLRRDGTDVLVAISDEGQGISSDELSRIFERYYRGSGQPREVAGEGIGLAVCSEIVNAHGGRIWAMSPGPGKGSTFFVALPAVAPPPADAATDAPAPAETSRAEVSSR